MKGNMCKFKYLCKCEINTLLTVEGGHGVVVDVLARLDEHDGEDDDESHGDVGAVDQVGVQGQPAAARDGVQISTK